jgi:hypothetical protein
MQLSLGMGWINKSTKEKISQKVIKKRITKRRLKTSIKCPNGRRIIWDKKNKKVTAKSSKILIKHLRLIQLKINSTFLHNIEWNAQ